jgi:predicted metal-binding membrane protein
MMVAMMLPSATPVILLVLGTYRRRGRSARLQAAVFTSGYLVAWTAFSAVAAIAQLILHRAAVLTPAMASNSNLLGGAILLAAGAYQWLPFKASCLTHCRSPLAFIGEHWREGTRGALEMGLRHGAYCLGCCWMLMLLLFAAGVMNLLWVAIIALLVLVEKVTRRGVHIGRLAGVLLMAGGLWLIAAR